jgi:hypothetical protein
VREPGRDADDIGQPAGNADLALLVASPTDDMALAMHGQAVPGAGGDARDGLKTIGRRDLTQVVAAPTDDGVVVADRECMRLAGRDVRDAMKPCWNRGAAVVVDTPGGDPAVVVQREAEVESGRGGDDLVDARRNGSRDRRVCPQFPPELVRALSRRRRHVAAGARPIRDSTTCNGT